MENQPSRRYGSILRALWASIFIVIGTSTSLLSANPPESFNLQNSRWQVRITPARLAFCGKPFGVDQEIMLASPTDQAEWIADLKVRKDGLSWRVPQKELDLAAINQLRHLGVDRACLVYEQDPRERENDSTYLTPAVIARAKELGYLIGPYDTFNNIQDPKKADGFESVYDDELYQTGGVLKSDGTRHPGFRGRGYDLSSEALKRAERPFIEERVNSHLQAGVNSYFIDVDATGELYDDFDQLHPMTIATDRF